MRNLSIIQAVILIVIGAITMLADVQSAAGQSTRTLSTVGRRIDDFNKQSDKVARDEMDREMRGRKPNAEERRLAEIKKAQLKEDFETLQKAYNDIVTKLHAKETLSAEYISEITEAIGKSASRLRHNIEFPVAEAGKKAPDQVSPTVSIASLCLQIHAFLTSPIFETGVLDIAAAEKARDTLDAIIHTSGALRQQTGKSE
jgi:hypothetical protein